MGLLKGGGWGHIWMSYSVFILFFFFFFFFFCVCFQWKSVWHSCKCILRTSCKLICMKCQILFSGKKKKNHTADVCWICPYSCVKAISKIVADNTFFSIFFRKKIRFSISCESSASQTIQMKCQAYFLWKIKLIKMPSAAVVFWRL